MGTATTSRAAGTKGRGGVENVGAWRRGSVELRTRPPREQG